MAAFYIGMDLGGTTFKALAVTPEGTILDRVQAPTEASQGPEAVVQRMVEAIRGLAARVTTAERRLRAVGFGVPGILELPQGIVRRSPNLPGWHDVELAALLRRALDVPFTLDNDANAATLGELWRGAARGKRDFFMLTLGTGVGGGVVVAGTILHGANGYAGELGHTVVDPHGPPCGCGSRGCLEQYASGTAIARMAEPFYGKTTAREVALAARRGEIPAQQLYRQVGYYLGIACASLANVFNPECLVLGGAVAQAFDLFAGSLRQTLRARSFGPIVDRLELVVAQCGTDAGGLGAAYQAMQAYPPAASSPRSQP
ncbi:MAG: sugar kinase [Candidatus Tectimicrobiota bacterium]|nr:MAG: sugar kinase [Candidatus Tectomicrobia bacterium]